MSPVCSATSSCCPSHSQLLLHGGLHRSSSFQKDFEAMEYRGFMGLSNAMHFQRGSVKAHATKSLYTNLVKSAEQSMDCINRSSCSYERDLLDCEYSDTWSSFGRNIDNQHSLGRLELRYVDSSSILAADEGVSDLTDQFPENASVLSGPVEPNSISATDLAQGSSSSMSEYLDMNNDQLSSVKTNVDDLIGEVSKSFSASLEKGENAVKSSVETVTSSVSSVVERANEAVDNAVSGIFSTVDKTGQLSGTKLTSFSSAVKESASKGGVIAVDVFRRVIIVVEDSLANGASYVLSSYQSSKDHLPPDISDALNLSERRAAEFLEPAKAAFQQVYIAIEGLEEFLGLNPNDPIVPFVLFLVTSATIWVIYLVWTYSGYSGDLSPQSTLELLTGKDSAVLIDVRPEVLREREGVPDLRRSARSRYASVTLPEIDAAVVKLLKSGRDLDDTLTAAVIRNLKIVQDRSKVIIMDADGTRSKGIARSLRKLGLKKPYLVHGGFRSWAKDGLRIKELRPETALTILSEDAEAILEDFSPSSSEVLGYGVGLIVGLYALVEWEKTLQLIGIFGLGQTVYRRVSSYQNAEDFKRDVRLLLVPAKVGAEAFSWAAGKLESNGIGLPTSPSSSDVKNRVLQAAAKHESQPSDSTDGNQDSSPGIKSVNETVDLSEA